VGSRLEQDKKRESPKSDKMGRGGANEHKGTFFTIVIRRKRGGTKGPCVNRGPFEFKLEDRTGRVRS